MTNLNVAEPPGKSRYEIEVFYDGQCPLCRREMAILRRLDRKRRICFTDIAAECFDATELLRADCSVTAGTWRRELADSTPDNRPTLCELKLEPDRLMSEIHGRLPDGRWITGVEVFRRLYAAVGCRWLVPITRLPGIAWILEFGYRVFARNRLQWTGRCSPDGQLCSVQVPQKECKSR